MRGGSLPSGLPQKGAALGSAADMSAEEVALLSCVCILEQILPRAGVAGLRLREKKNFQLVRVQKVD